MTDEAPAVAHPPPLSEGVWGVLPTPFRRDDLAVDDGSLRRVVDFYREHEATGLVALGVFGEAARLDTREQTAVVRTVVDRSAGLPVVAGLPALATAPAVEQATRVVEAGQGAVTAVMVQVNTADPDALRRHLAAVNHASGVGIVVQDYPLVSGVRITSAALALAITDCPGIVAVKSEAPPTSVAIAQLVSRTSVPVFGGLGGVGLLDELAAGAAGAMTGFSHPEGLWDAIRAFRAGGFQAARRAYAPWLPLANFEGQPGIGLALRKEILRRRGVIADAAVRPPALPLPRELEPLISGHLDQIPTAEPV